MKIVQINAVYETGSTGRIVMELYRAIKAAGDECYVFCTNRSDEANGIYCMGTVLSRKLHGLMSRLTGLQGYFSFLATRKMLKKLDEIRPDVVHLHNLHGNYIHVNMLLDYLIRHQIPTVITLHDCWFFTGHCCHFIEDNCDRWQHGCGHCPARHKWNKSWFFDRSAKVLQDRISLVGELQNLTVIGCSKWITQLAERSPVFRGARVEQIYNGVDTCIFYPRGSDLKEKFGLAGQFTVLGMANKWYDPTNRAGVDMILRSFGDSAFFLIVGCGKEASSFFSRYSNVHVLPFIQAQGELAEIYSAADVFVNLTHADTLPTVNMESICCGTPVICYSDSGGGPELVRENKTGFVIPKQDITKLIDTILAMRDHPLNRAVCADIGRSFFDKTYNYQQYYKEYSEWY